MTPDEFKSLSRGESIDMSPAAISRRLDIAAELWKLTNELSSAKYLGKAEAIRDEALAAAEGSATAAQPPSARGA